MSRAALDAWKDRLAALKTNALLGPTARFWRDAVDKVFDPVVEAALKSRVGGP